MTWTSNVEETVRYNMLEFFSGTGHVSACFRENRYSVANFELRDEPSMDWCSSAGFALIASNRPSFLPKATATCFTRRHRPRLALVMLLQSSPGALHLFAPVCSSWTRISRGTSLRTCINCFGDLSVPFVQTGNLMISRQGYLI